MAVIPAEGTTVTIAGTELEVLSVQPPGGRVAEVETTNLSNTDKTFRPSQIGEAGEVTLTVQYDPAVHGALLTKTVVACSVNYPGGAADSFQGFVTALDPDEAGQDSNHEASITIRITGAVTRTPAA